MSMQLEARQRAILLEMGVRVWAAPPVHPQPAERAPQSAAPPSPTAAAPPLPQHVPAPRPPRADPVLPAAPGASTPDRSSAKEPLHWNVQAPQLLYPDVDAALTPPALGAGWLVVAEACSADDPQAESAERLQANMLRALQLHRHPRIWLCNVSPASSPADAGLDPAAVIAQHVEQFAPSVVLVMGPKAARAALGRSEPLGQLRGVELSIGAAPAVVTFGAHFLLRSPASKPAAWADLCRARALAGREISGPMP